MTFNQVAKFTVPLQNGFNGLASKVQNVLKDDPFSGHLFIFRGRRGDQIKV
ncbi:IS66 family insertion sequence element accessory protein TnpB, partial [Escherichia coli]|uniref:IS66 family insertion sequence element accessory protein TnpB n=1 Tax=Escherichia coli TaxID=562 RepID=UPI0024486CD9